MQVSTNTTQWPKKWFTLIFQITQRVILYPPAASQNISATRASCFNILTPEIFILLPSVYATNGVN